MKQSRKPKNIKYNKIKMRKSFKYAYICNNNNNKIETNYWLQIGKVKITIKK